MQNSKFAHTKENPYHLSVGAVVQREDGQVLCLSAGGDVHGMGDFRGYLLMRETVEDNESLEDAVARGMTEEFGVTGTITRFLGSIVCTFHQPGLGDVEKTTPYFLVSYEGEREGGRTAYEELELKATREWVTIPFLLEHTKKQAKLAKRPDIDESAILERL